MKKTIRKILSKLSVLKDKTTIIILVGSLISILLGVLVANSIAKYKEGKIINVLANIAKPIVEIDKQECFKITTLNPEVSYMFEVRNYNEKEISEVEMEYYIEIISDVKEEVKFSMYKNEEEISLINNKTEKMYLTKENKDIHMYRLDIKYDKEQDKSEENILKEIQIKIHAIQKI